jgi:hypothetical protein
MIECSEPRFVRQPLGTRAVIARGNGGDVTFDDGAWGSQKSMSMSRYSITAVASAARACSRGTVVTYRVQRPWWQWATRGCIPSAVARVRACW